MSLERWGVVWVGPTEPTCKVMPDGYWTPWHIAEAALKAERQENEKLRKELDGMYEDLAGESI